MDEQDVLREIKRVAEDALSTGRTWSVADRLAYLEEALEAIVKLSQEKPKKENK